MLCKTIERAFSKFYIFHDAIAKIIIFVYNDAFRDIDTQISLKNNKKFNY